MIQQGTQLSQNQVRKNILRSQQLQQIIQKNTTQTPLPKNPIQQQIQKIITPIKQQIKKDVLTQQTTLQQIKRFSIMGFVAKIYQQLLVYLLQQSKIPNFNNSGVRIINKTAQKVMKILRKHTQSIQDRLFDLIQTIQNQKRKQSMKDMIIFRMHDAIQEVLKICNYQVYPSDINKLLFNTHSVPFQYNNNKIIKQRHSSLISEKLHKMKFSSNYDDVVNKQTVTILKKVFKQNQIKKTPQHHWSHVQQSQMQLIQLQKGVFLTEAGIIQNYEDAIQNQRMKKQIDDRKKAYTQNRQLQNIIQTTRSKAKIK